MTYRDEMLAARERAQAAERERDEAIEEQQVTRDRAENLEQQLRAAQDEARDLRASLDVKPEITASKHRRGLVWALLFIPLLLVFVATLREFVLDDAWVGSAAPRAALGKSAVTRALTDVNGNTATKPFDSESADAALGRRAASAAASCRKEGDPAGTAVVVISYAPSGRVMTAIITGPPFARTATGNCIASVMSRAEVPPFSGSHITVTRTVVIR